MQWFLSELAWNLEGVNWRRVDLLVQRPSTAPNEDGVLVMDEHEDHKWGKKTAHMGRQRPAVLARQTSGWWA